MSLDILCPNCGSSASSEQAAAGFCPACGASLTPGAPAAGLTPLAPDQGLTPLEPVAEAEGLTPLEPVAEAPPAAGLTPLAPQSAPPARPPATPPPMIETVSDDGDGGEETVENVNFGEDAEKIDGEMDMTPMVDVTFLLLIFFMVTASFSLQKSIQVPKPEQTDLASTNFEEREEDNEDVITVIIDQFNTFRVQTADFEEEAPSRHELLRKLRRARDDAPGGNPPSKLLVKAHAEAFHEHTVTALDAGVEVGMDSMQLMVVEEDL